MYNAAMIRMITGTVVDVSLTAVVVDVSGIGYLVHTSTSTVRNGETVSFWTYLAVRETALDLYGFATRDELALFELLLTVPKIGPKSAAQILAQADLSLIRSAVFEQDASRLSKLSGIGKKTAENIVLGLKDKLGDETAYTNDTTAHGVRSEVVDALISLGYPHASAREAAAALPSDLKNTNDAIREALKHLSRS